jgi:D-alanine-D-alanine ligase
MGARHGGAWFAEKFVDGREFHAAAIAEAGRVRVLPVCEIDYRKFPPGVPRILDYAAKWHPDSYQYEGHEYEFDLPECDRPLVRRIEALTVSCWQLFRLAGYARVDFRVDAAGEPWILEVNPNPCLTGVCNFSDMLTRAGITFDRAIETIVGEAVGAPPVLRAAAR